MRIPKGGIAFFVSGIGGLTVLAECMRAANDCVFYYYGDNKHAPYGNLSPKKIKRLVGRVFRKFSRLRVQAAVIACNTATAVCVEELRKKYTFPIVGAEPAVFSAAKNGGNVFILATRATIESDRFERLCDRALLKYPKATLEKKACPALAGEIERRLFDSRFNPSSYLPKGSPNAVVLGCTHYIYIRRYIEAFYQCPVYDGNRGIANRLFSLLEKNGRENRDGRPPRIFFLGSRKTYNKSIFEQMFAINTVK